MLESHGHQKEEEMKPFEKCPVFGGELVEREVEKLLRGGVNTAVARLIIHSYHHHIHGKITYIRSFKMKRRRRNLRLLLFATPKGWAYQEIHWAARSEIHPAMTLALSELSREACFLVSSTSFPHRIRYFF
jgi:hypothetical protein